MYLKNEIFFRPAHKDFIQIAGIETHGKDNTGKKIKLSNQIYHFTYLLNHKPNFTTYEKEITNMVSFNRWIKHKNGK